MNIISYNNILFIKENLVLINILAGFVSFMIGISPLFIEREVLEKQTKPIIIEFTAFIFLIYTISSGILGYISDKPLYRKNQCISYKEKYYIDNEFKKYFYLEDKLLIKELGDENYLLKNLNSHILYKMPISEDYKFKKINCN
jgi:hypothetical protein